MKTATMDLDDVVFITFSEFLAYAGGEQITYRIVKLLEALQQTDTVSTLVHFGNPKVLGPLPHFKRKIIGGHSVQSVETCLEVLAGNYPAKGTVTYDVKFK